MHGQPLMTVRRTVAVERPGVYLVRYERDNDTTGELELVQSVYVNETGRFVWTPHGGATTATPPLEQVTTDGPQDDELTISSLYWLLAAPNPRVVRIVDRNETRLYRVDLSTDSNAEVERIDGYALVDRSGLVHTVRKSYEMSSGVEIELEVRYMDVGSTNVDPPAWLANVTANASSMG